MASAARSPTARCYARDNVIAAGRADGDAAGTRRRGDRRARHVVLPGLVNTHHHFYQTLTRNVPAAQDAELFDWLSTLYPIWAGLTPEAVYVSSQIAHGRADALGLHHVERPHLHLARTARGWTTRSGPRRRWASASTPRAARCRVGESQGGLPPDRVVEDEAAILRDSRRLIEQYHDPRPGAMLRIVAGALLALLGLARPDARERRPGPRLRRPSAHPPGRDAGRGALLPGRLRPRGRSS